MSLNEEKIYHDKIYHDNNSYCFMNHTCIDCEHENTLFDEEPCNLCVHNKLCKWKPKSEKVTM